MRIEQGISLEGLAKFAIPFPEDPKIIDLDGLKFYEYVAPKFAMEKIAQASRDFRLSDYDYVIVPADGGFNYYNMLCVFQSDNKERHRRRTVTYRRKKDGTGIDVIDPVPQEIKRGKNLIIDDIFNTGLTLHTILEDSPNSDVAVAVMKVNVPYQIPIYRSRVVFTTMFLENYWLAGIGNDFGPDYHPGFGRNWNGIIVRIPTES